MYERPPIRGERAKRFAAISVARYICEAAQHGHYCITRGDRHIARDARVRNGLDWVNFFLAGMQAGFGPFVAVLLADEHGARRTSAFVLSVGGFAALLSQIPGGELLDVTRSKRFLVTLGAIASQSARW